MIKWLEKNKIITIMIVILLSIEIFYFSTLQGGTGTGGNVWIARAYHFIVFFLLAFFICITIKGEKKLRLSYILIAIIFSILQAILDETHQIFVPLRDASMRDILTDSLGIFFAMITYLVINKKTVNR